MTNDDANDGDDSSDYTATTVQFDVGGTLFKTSRSIFRRGSQQHGECTMLERLVSETWLHNPTIPIFIDRSPVLFGYVLDYLRYGSITLPITVSKEMFVRDLDYYGIFPIDGSTIRTSPELWADEVDKRHEDIENINKAIAHLVQQRRYLELCNHIDLFANHCSNEYINGSCIVDIYIPTAMTTNNNYYNESNNEGTFWDSAMAVYMCKNTKEEEEDEDNKAMMLFQKSLSKFGLRLKDINVHGARCTLLVERLSSCKKWAV
jgi:hypothetical protein